jgi:large subunit ribosomal protein L10
MIMAHVAKYKESKVEELTNMLLDNPVIGIIDIEGIPASQLQQIRKNLPSDSKFVVTKNTLLRIALNRAKNEKKNIEGLMDSLDGQRGMIVVDINCFRLFRAMEQTKIKAPAKGGEAAPFDIEIEEGDTPFKPGPIVGELQKAGFPAAIERGKVVMKKDKVLVKEGERIPRDVAKMLTRLEIYPITVGLSLMAGFENGLIFTREVLDVDVDGYINNMKAASSQAFNLSMFVCYPTNKNITTLMQNAHQNAFNLAINAEIPTPKSIIILLSKAQMQALSLASQVPESKGSKEIKGEKTKDSKVKEEEKKEEPPSSE